MSLAELTREAVLTAIAEFDPLGRAAFLESYGFGPARESFVELNGQHYDSKAIAGAAHRYTNRGAACPGRKLRLLAPPEVPSPPPIR
jgi:hypothetical protein